MQHGDPNNVCIIKFRVYFLDYGVVKHGGAMSH